jgi:DNA-binding MarR family transcriptional regulator
MVDLLEIWIGSSAKLGNAARAGAIDEQSKDGISYSHRRGAVGTLRHMDQLFEFAMSVKALQREMERRMNDSMRPFGLTAAQADAILVIGQAQPLSLKDLGELLIAEAGHPSRLVDRLVEAGVVERRPADDDRRRVELSLTAEGRRLERQALQAREAVLSAGHALLADRDLEPTLEIFRDLLSASPFAELVARRLELLGSAHAGR